ncbi:MAG TPA: manganese efflux pump [Limnochordia bacterium]|nr:manganese efflux pump [Limnochordia bacterium]
MSRLESIMLALALGADVFTVTLGLGVTQAPTRRRVARFAGLFGGVAAGMITVGYACAFGLHSLVVTLERLSWMHFGRMEPAALARTLHGVFSLLGAAVLAGLGLNQFAEARGSRAVWLGRGRFAMLLLAISVSVDAAMAGVGLGMLDNVNLPWTVIAVGGCSAGLSGLGLGAGHRVGRLAGTYARWMGGTLLILLSLHFAYAAL